MSEALHTIFGPDLGAAAAAAFLRANLAIAAAILVVAVVRLPIRRIFGPAAAYQLWLLPPITAVAALALPLLQSLPDPAAGMLAAHSEALRTATLVWALGAAAAAGLFAFAQALFLAELRAGRAGPAVVGLISPRIVMPPDDGRYSRAELELIRAHEREHVARKDPRAVALAALAQCVCWFNPLVHVAARLLRLDQELACDAAVVLSRPKARGLYARTLLKTQLAATPLPLGCYWPSRARHPLEVRVALLKPRPGSGGRTEAGSTVVLAARDAIRP